MKLLGLLLAWVSMRVECTSLSFNYKTNPVCNGKRSTGYIWNTLQHVSKTKCVIVCDREVMCVLVTYNTDTRVCYLHTHTLYDLLPTMMADNKFVCLLPADFLESWVQNIIAASPYCCGYTHDFMIGAVDGWPWIPELAPTAFVEITDFKTCAVRLDIVLVRVDEYIDSIKLVGKSNLRLRA